MKKLLQLSVCFAFFVLSLSAQDTLKIDFQKTGVGTAETDFTSMEFADKVEAPATPTSFTTDFGTVVVSVIWLPLPSANSYRAISRASTFYTGSLYNLLDDYIAADGLNDGNSNIIAIKLTGLTAGTYTWKSYHHDTNDQIGQFFVNVKNRAGVIFSSTDTFQITHSNPSRATNPGNVTNSIDSVCKFITTNAVSAGTEDTLTFTFSNIYPPNAPEIASHANKFVLINGFELSKNGGTNVSPISSNKINVFTNRGEVSINGRGIKSVDVYSINGVLVKRVANTADIVVLGGMKYGIYLAKVKFANGQVVNKKIVVH